MIKRYYNRPTVPNNIYFKKKISCYVAKLKNFSTMIKDNPLVKPREWNTKKNEIRQSKKKKVIKRAGIIKILIIKLTIPTNIFF